MPTNGCYQQTIYFLVGQYNVTITTHYNSHPPKAASIFLTAYGKKGQSEEICLQKNLDDKWSFEPGTIDEFEVFMMLCEV